MFKKLIFATVILIAASCDNNKPAQKTAQAVIHRKAYSAEQQQKIIGDINFGISQKQFDKFYKQYLKSKGCNAGCVLGKFSYDREFTRFKNDQLYSLKLSNFGVKYDGHDKSIPNLLNDAYQEVKLQYGEADVSHPLSDQPSVQSFTNHLLKRWVIGSKTIDITLKRINAQYGIELEIYQPAFKTVAN